MKLVAILRAKNEILVIRNCLSRLSELVNEIIVLDNGSTDGTLNAYKEFPKVVKILQTEEYHEGRDKILLLEEAKKRNPDWILWIDSDEIFEKHFTRNVIEKYMQSKHNRITFRLCHFWQSEKRCRIDKVFFLYSLHPQRSMWRNVPVAYFKDQKMHNGDIRGIKGGYYISPYRLKHYGYVFKEKTKNKMNAYEKIDKSGDRVYDHLDPQKKFLTYPFFEFNNKTINYLWILFFKYLCNILWLWLRLILKIKKLFTKEK